MIDFFCGNVENKPDAQYRIAPKQTFLDFFEDNTAVFVEKVGFKEDMGEWRNILEMYS